MATTATAGLAVRPDPMGMQRRMEDEMAYWKIKTRVQEQVRRAAAATGASDASTPAAAPCHAALVQLIRRSLSSGSGAPSASAGAELQSLVHKLADARAADLAHERRLAHGGSDPRPQLPLPPDALSFLFDARVEWEKRLRFELRAVAHKQGRKLVELRDPSRLGSVGASTSVHALAGYSGDATMCAAVTEPLPDDFQVRFVYTAEDLLEVVAALRNPNRAPSIPAPPSPSLGAAKGAATTPLIPQPSPPPLPPPLGWGMVQLDLCAPRMEELVLRYASLSPSVRQVGVDDAVLGLEWFGAERRAAGEELLVAAGAASTPAAVAASLAALRSYARTGVPSALRPACWARMLGVPLPLPARPYLERYAALLGRVERWKMLTDDLALFDVADGPGDDEAFFVFTEQLGEMALVFARDDEVHRDASVLVNAAPLAAVPTPKLKQKLEQHAQMTGQEDDFVRFSRGTLD